MRKVVGLALLLVLAAAIYFVSVQATGADTQETETTQEIEAAQPSESAETTEDVAEVSEDAVVIRLGEYEERLGDFNERFEIAMLGVAAQQGAELDEALRAQLSSFRPQFLEQRATELALLEEARTRDLSVSEEDLETQLEQIRSGASEEESFEDIYSTAGFESETQLRSFLTEQLLVEQLITELQDEVEVTDEDIAAAYEARAAEFATGEQVCARHILLETEEDAQAVLGELENGADFAELAQERSTGPSGPDGGDLGCFERERMVAPFAEAAFDADLDTPVGPVETQFGQHVILVYDRQEAGAVPLEEVSGQLEGQLSQEAFIASIDELRAASGIEVFPEMIATSEAEVTSDPEESADEAEDADQE